jgi:hypothetical protein
MSATTIVWQGLDVPRLELARAEVDGGELRASGTQLGVAYELRYELTSDLLRLDLVGERRLEVGLGGLDFFDLGNSPLFNSLPVLRDRLLDSGVARDYVMRWVSVPSSRSTSRGSVTSRSATGGSASRPARSSLTSTSTTTAS